MFNNEYLFLVSEFEWRVQQNGVLAVMLFRLVTGTKSVGYLMEEEK
jgi:hypothetical protein